MKSNQFQFSSAEGEIGDNRGAINIVEAFGYQSIWGNGNFGSFSDWSLSVNQIAGTAEEGEDFDLQWSFGGKGEQTIGYAIFDDDEIEGDEYAIIEFSGQFTHTEDPEIGIYITETFGGTFRLDIFDNDFAEVTTSALTEMVGENASGTLFEITLTEPLEHGVSVIYQMSGSATENEDYQFMPGVVTFSPGETSATIDIVLYDDEEIEESETLALTVTEVKSNGTAIIGSPSSSSILINDNDDDLAECKFDIDGDGKLDSVELSYSEANSILKNLEKSERFYIDQLKAMTKQLEHLEEQREYLGAEAKATLLLYAAQVASLAAINAPAKLLPELSSIFANTYTVIVNGVPVKSPVKNAMVDILGVVNEFTKSPVKWLPVVSLVKNTSDVFNNGLNIAGQLSEIRQQTVTLVEQFEQKKDQLDDIVASQVDIFQCIDENPALQSAELSSGVSSKSSFASGGQVLSAGVNYLENSEHVYLETSESLPQGMFLAAGSSLSDIVFAKTNSSQNNPSTVLIDSKEGDDLIQVGEGNFYATDSSGHDSIQFFDRDGQLTSIKDILLMEVLASNPKATVFGIGERLSCAVEGIEKFVFREGYYSLIEGDLTFSEEYDNLFVGGGFDEKFVGGKGSDTISGGAGSDTLEGGAGADSILAGNGHNLVLAGDGHDYLSAFGGNDEVYGGTGNDTLFAGAGNDSVGGAGGNDQIGGGAGDDELWGGAGNDTIYGGAGSDTIGAGSENDEVGGGAGNDTVWAGAGNDSVYGNDGDDEISGGLGADLIYAGSGNDTIYAGNGNDTVGGVTGDDEIWMGGGNDVAYGWTGNDTLLGLAGDDDLWGGDGNDVLNGGAGNDTLRGGADADTLVFSAGADRALGFGSGDRIDLSGVAAITSFADLQANHLTGGAQAVISDGLGNSLTLTGVAEGTLDAGDFIF